MNNLYIKLFISNAKITHTLDPQFFLLIHFLKLQVVVTQLIATQFLEIHIITCSKELL